MRRNCVAGPLILAKKRCDGLGGHESPVFVDAERGQPAPRKKGGQREAELAQAKHKGL